jgi:hypothetical protein
MCVCVNWTYVCVCVNWTYVCVCMCSHAQEQVFMCRHAQDACMYAYTQPHEHARAHTNMHTHDDMHTHVYTNTHNTWVHRTSNSTITYIRTYIHTHRYFEIIEIVRKLVMASVLIFVYEGTSSQIATGFIVTNVALLLSLWLRPFNDGSLQNMHEWSLFVQSLTLLAGVMIKTDQFTEILGEKGGQGRAALGGILIFFHFLVAVTPLLDKLVQQVYIWYVSSQREGSILACCRTDNIEEGDSEMDTGATPPQLSYQQQAHQQQVQQPPQFPTYTQAAPSTSERRNVDLFSTKAGAGASAAPVPSTSDKRGAGASAAPVPSTSDKRQGEFFQIAGAVGVGEKIIFITYVCMYVCVCVCVYVCMCFAVGVGETIIFITYVCMYACVCVCVYVCMCFIVKHNEPSQMTLCR